MTPDELLTCMREGATVKTYSYRKKHKHVVELLDGKFQYTQYSVIRKLVSQKVVSERRWFGGSQGDYKYELIKEAISDSNN